MQFCLVFQQLALALAHAHSNEIMHRDIKPSNILVNAHELQEHIEMGKSSKLPVRLIDFGLARFTGAESRHSNKEMRSEQSASIAGTPAYMAPDAAHSGIHDERSEVYALGCVMVESLTGQQPFQADTALELLQMHASAVLPSLSSVTAIKGRSVRRASCPMP
jgi:serine/threonine-protein kinase